MTDKDFETMCNPSNFPLSNAGADVIPNGKRLKRYRPYGVINVVSFDDSEDNSIYQNPELASNFEKCLAFPI